MPDAPQAVAPVPDAPDAPDAPNAPEFLNQMLEDAAAKDGGSPRVMGGHSRICSQSLVATVSSSTPLGFGALTQFAPASNSSY